MNRCRETRQLQDYLDDELTAERARAFETHMESCASCAAEARAYRALFDSLGHSLTAYAAAHPGPALTERILDRVLPSRLRRRWVQVFGWVYGTATAASTFAFVSWITRSESQVWLAKSYSEVSLRAMQSMLFAFQMVARSWLDLLDGWVLLERFAGRLSPVFRALARPLADPTLALITVAAALACVAVLWWMRPRGAGAGEEIRNVSLLGF